MLEANGATF